MQGKVVLVAGANGGFGTYVTQAFLDTGATVIGTSRKIQRSDFGSPSFTALPAEISSREGATVLVDQIVASIGRLDVLAHTVGGFAGGQSIADTDDGAFHRMVDLNLISVVAGLQKRCSPLRTPHKDGSDPNGTLVFDKAADLYGTTTTGGKSNAGTVFKLSPVTSGKKKGTWTEKVLYTFKGGTEDGANPYGGIVFDSAGNAYGATVSGGKDGDGVVYELVFSPSTGKYKEKVLWSLSGTGGTNPGAQGWVSLIPDGEGNFDSVAAVGGRTTMVFWIRCSPISVAVRS